MIQTDISSFSYKKGSLVPFCKKCGSEHFHKKGKNRKNLPKYECKNCGFRFVWTSDLPKRRFFSNIMGFAVELYTSLNMAASLVGVTKILKKVFDLDVSHESIRQWTRASKLDVSRRKIIEATHWHADETYFKIKGQGHWLWVVFCEDTKQVLAWHISKKRLHKDAVTVFRKALDIAGTRPSKITTDGLYQYQSAIKKVMGWEWHEYKKRHIIDSGIGKNAIIERLNREIKRRLKWFSTFQSMNGALAFFGLWFYHHNQVKAPYLT
jgi:transposase-like protein/DNA-directed RNA polymerase subunit RPC12/RpoP